MSVGGTICSVAVCNNSYYKAKNENSELSFFRFPKDPTIKKEWIIKCYRKDKWNVDNGRICSIHFKQEDFERDLQNELMNLPPRKILKKDAVPSLFLKPNDTTKGISARSLRMQKKATNILVEKLLQSENIEKENLFDQEVKITDDEPYKLSEGDLNYETLQKQYKIVLEENNTLKLELQSFTAKCKSYEEEIVELKRKINQVQTDKEKDNIKFREVISKVLTRNQLDLITNNKKKVSWTSQELSNAFTIRYFSKRCYIYLQKTLKYPLPGISTLQKWASNIDLRHGLLHDVFQIMKIEGETMTRIEKVVILSFDEMKVDSLYEYDQKNDEVVGPHSYMQVMMARGLFKQWKQPLFIEFDKKITKDILDSIIIALHNINYEVVACVSDCGGGNVGLWKELGITPECTFYSSPVNKNKIYFFADAPHLLKLIRNWLLDSGFTLGNGQIVNKAPLVSLIENTTTEISSCHRLRMDHIKCEKTQRQNVTFAAQLLSHTTATALKQYLPGLDKTVANNVADFCDLCNSWFDVMNSYTTMASLPTKQPYGKQINLQNEILKNMEQTIRNMCCTSKKGLQTFQKAILISISSLLNLFKDLQTQYKISYILTHRLNQDCLENFFSQIRSRGGLHDHPSPLNCLYRIRLILLGTNPGMIQKNANTTCSETEEYITTRVLKKSKLAKPFALIEPAVSIDVPPPNSQQEEDKEESEDDLSVSSLPNLSQNEAIKRNSENDGLEYLAGYIAKKFKNTHNLGYCTYKNTNEHCYAIPNWLQHLSFGGLIQPSKQWMKQVHIMEKKFNQFDGKTSFKSGQNIVKR